jgi:hypothetical protein
MFRSLDLEQKTVPVAWIYKADTGGIEMHLGWPCSVAQI